jgi:hypothetical protein
MKRATPTAAPIIDGMPIRATTGNDIQPWLACRKLPVRAPRPEIARFVEAPATGEPRYAIKSGRRKWPRTNPTAAPKKLSTKERAATPPRARAS